MTLTDGNEQSVKSKSCVSLLDADISIQDILSNIKNIFKWKQ